MEIYIFGIIALVLYILSFTLLRRFYRLYTSMRTIVTALVAIEFLNLHLYIPAVMFFFHTLLRILLPSRLSLKLFERGILERAQTALFLGIPSLLSIVIGTIIEKQYSDGIHRLFSVILPTVVIILNFIFRFFDGKIIKYTRTYPIFRAIVWGAYSMLMGVYFCALFETANMIQHIPQMIAFRKSCRSMQRPEGSVDSVNGADGTSNIGSDEAAVMQDFTYFKGQW